MNWQYLDPRTMAITLGLSTLLLAGSIFIASRALVARHQGLHYAALGLGMAAAGFICIMLQGVVPPWVNTALGNGLILVGNGLMLAGTLRQRGLSVPWSKLGALWLGGLGVGLWFGVVQPDSRLRIGLVSCILFVESAWLAKAAWSEQRSNVMAGMRLVALFGGVLAALMATRTLAAATGLLSENLRPNLLNVGSILVGGMAMIGASLGLVYITTGDLLNRLQHSARHDPLTHLLNRQGLRWWLKGLPPIAKLEIAMVDLDHLKTINDKYGHAVGDRTIQRLAELLQSACTGDSCQAVRMGGEEFALIHVVPDLPFGTTGGPSDATLSAGFVAKLETLRQALHAQAEHPQASLSAGLAAGSVQGFEACLRIADLRLYDAKRRGRNQVVFS